mgnify:CR=1 FL=1
MSFFKSFAASLLAWVIGVAVLIIGSVSVMVGALLSMESSQKPIENNTVLYFDLNEGVKKAFDEKGIEIPYPQMDIHVKNDK